MGLTATDQCAGFCACNVGFVDHSWFRDSGMANSKAAFAKDLAGDSRAGGGRSLRRDRIRDGSVHSLRTIAASDSQSLRLPNDQDDRSAFGRIGIG